MSPGQHRDRAIARLLSPMPPFVCTGAAAGEARSPLPLLQDSSTLPQLSMSTITHEPKLHQASTPFKRNDDILICSSRSEEHTSELQSLLRISYAVFCLKQKSYIKNHSTPLRINTIISQITHLP